MADHAQSPSRGSTPSAGTPPAITAPSSTTIPSVAPPLRRPLPGDENVNVQLNAPAVSSPLNPNPNPNPDASKSRPSRPPGREQREKRDTLKKRESTAGTRANTPDVKAKSKLPATPSPMRYAIPEPKPADFEPPREGVFASHEPLPFLTPDGETELKRPVDHAWNKKSYRYTHCVADPLFRHKQYFRQSDSKPYGPRMSHEDSDRWFHFDETATIITNEKGWRMGRGNVCAREGRLYYEVKILRGVPAEGPPVPPGQENNPLPHIRMGWARREAPLDAPVGFDGYSYGITDIRFETMHKSRPGKIYNKKTGKGKSSAKSKSSAGTGKAPAVEYIPDNQHLREGDVVGLEIQLPSLSLHRKVADGIYNPAVDLGDGFDESPDPQAAPDIIRDRIPVPYKGNYYFEQLEYHSTKPMEQYGDRGPTPKVAPPHPNHEQPELRTLPHSAIRVYRNGALVGTAFDHLLAFLPPASQPSPANGGGGGGGARVGFDDGMLGYFPAVAAFSGGVAQVNFGPHFWCPPAELREQQEQREQDQDVQMGGMDEQPQQQQQQQQPSPADLHRRLRPIGARYPEQIAEDVVWDLVDEVDFFVQDGGFAYAGGPAVAAGSGSSGPAARGISVDE